MTAAADCARRSLIGPAIVAADRALAMLIVARRLAATAQGLERRPDRDDAAARGGAADRSARAGGMADADAGSGRIPPREAARAIRRRAPSPRSSIPAARPCATTSRRRAISCSRRRGCRMDSIVVDQSRLQRADRKQSRVRRQRRDRRLSCAFRNPAACSSPITTRPANIWFVRDQRAMAKDAAAGATSRRSISIRKARSRPAACRSPARSSVQLRNDHLGYALTWFGLAAGTGRRFRGLGLLAAADKGLTNGPAALSCASRPDPLLSGLRRFPS